MGLVYLQAIESEFYFGEKSSDRPWTDDGSPAVSKKPREDGGEKDIKKFVGVPIDSVNTDGSATRPVSIEMKSTVAAADKIAPPKKKGPEP
ncbi:MAG: hypothetical protein ACLPWS_01370 [Rhodomicrobium sp.]